MAHLKTAVSTKILNFRHHAFKEEDEIETLYGFFPQFSSNVKTSIGKINFWLLGKHFPKHHKYYKLLNRTNVKIN